MTDDQKKTRAEPEAEVVIDVKRLERLTPPGTYDEIEEYAQSIGREPTGDEVHALGFGKGQGLRGSSHEREPRSERHFGERSIYSARRQLAMQIVVTAISQGFLHHDSVPGGGVVLALSALGAGARACALKAIP